MLKRKNRFLSLCCFLFLFSLTASAVSKENPLPTSSYSKDSSPSSNKNSSSYKTKKRKQPKDFNYFSFSQIPILHKGRVKILGTFAREYLMALSGKSRLKKSSAESWLAETLFQPQKAFRRNVFKIWNPEVRDLLGLEKRKKNLYSFNEISTVLDKNIKELNSIQNKKEEERDLVETQLLELYGKATVYLQISRSFSFILPILSVTSEQTAKNIGILPNKSYSYLDLLPFQQKIEKEVKKKKRKNFDQFSEEEKELIILSYRMNLISQDEKDNELFRIIPPQWKDNKNLWHSPWSLIQTGRGSPASGKYLESWEDMEKAYRNGTGEKSAVENSYVQAQKLSKNFIRSEILFLENLFNRLQFFKNSLILYILAFLLFFFSALFKKNFFINVSFLALLAGAFLHGTGILFRMVILFRPPVATLYESVIFVGFLIVGFSLILKKTKRESLFLLTGSIAGIFLHLLAFKYKGAESMELLVPVLNTNFWLASHVLTITTGYAFALVTSLLSHLYIFLKYFLRKKTSPDQLSKLYNNIMTASFLALFFCLFGTILGGIWADQSWGRFWGWDPKENGALFIVLWLLVLFHGKWAGILKKDSWLIGHILTNVTVALSWFGVNLLNTGLHSYGFIEGVFWGLILFCSLELIFFLLSLIQYKYKFFQKNKV